VQTLRQLLKAYEAALRRAGEASEIPAYVARQTEAHRLEGVILTLDVGNALRKISERVGKG